MMEKIISFNSAAISDGAVFNSSSANHHSIVPRIVDMIALLFKILTTRRSNKSEVSIKEDIDDLSSCWNS